MTLYVILSLEHEIKEGGGGGGGSHLLLAASWPVGWSEEATLGESYVSAPIYTTINTPNSYSIFSITFFMDFSCCF